MPVEQQPPLILAMLVADTVLHDLPTDKMTIQGVYQGVGASTFPYTHPSIVVYVALTEGYGETPMQLHLVDGDEARPPIFELETRVDFDDPFAVIEIVFSQLLVTFPEPGEYRLQLFAAGYPLLERRLEILHLGDFDEP